LTPSFEGLSVLILESRRSKEMAALVTTYGGRPVAAPAMREIPLDSNPDALAFAERVLAGRFDIVILLTGVGTRALLNVIETKHSRDAFVAALARTKVVPRGPKPLAILRELNITPWVIVPEPNTWRELLAAIDEAVGRALSGSPRGPDKVRATEILEGMRVAVQEYGKSNPELLEGLETRGAQVTRVPVYRWALPEDVAPLQAAATAIARGELDVVLFTTSAQIVHLEQIAEAQGMRDTVREGLRRMVVASIGPTTSEELRHEGIEIDFEASHPKMGFLVREAADKAAGILRTKR
jgi:uroporphyrinogen-III synthase